MAEVGTFPIKILAQVADNEPVELGVYEIPVHASDAKFVNDDSYQVELSFGAGNVEELERVINRSLRPLIIKGNRHDRT